MDTHGQNFGYSVKAEIPESRQDMLRVGNELHGFLLDDWWPPVAGHMPMPGNMCCNTFWNINGGQRYDFGTFVEWERKWDRQWTTLLGVRNDTVWMDTGNVKGYSALPVGTPGEDVAVVSDRCRSLQRKDHARTDVNFDATALARYEPDSVEHLRGRLCDEDALAQPL